VENRETYRLLNLTESDTDDSLARLEAGGGGGGGAQALQER
jgi:hypothetical protein